MNKYRQISVLIILLVTIGVKSQETINKNDLTTDSIKVQSKSIEKKLNELIPDSLKSTVFKPDPMKSVWMGAIIPGYGQILNKMYWKLPIVYGGFLGCAYAITWNSGKYENYKLAYRDILHYQDPTDPAYKALIDKDMSKASFVQIIPKGYALGDGAIGTVSQWTQTIKGKQDTFRRYRDLSMIVTVAYYAMTLVDAYVDAQLYDFDISPDLSMSIQPAFLADRYNSSNALGIQCSFCLK